MRMIFVSFTDANETLDIYTKGDNITIMSDILKLMMLLMNFLIFFVEDIRKDYKQK